MWRRLPLTYSAGIVSSGVALLLLTGVLFAQQRPTINNWSLLALVYGVLVPNTWRRGAMVLGLVVLAAVATLVLASLGNARLRPFLPGNIASTLFLVGTVAMMGLYGSHKRSSSSAPSAPVGRTI